MTRKTKAQSAETKAQSVAATDTDLARLKTWGTVLTALEALQKAYTETAAEHNALVERGEFTSTARAVRNDLEDTLRSLEAELWRNARSSGLSLPNLITI